MAGSKSNKLEQQSTRICHKAEIEAAWMLHTSAERTLRRAWLHRHMVKQRNRCAYCNVLMRESHSPGWQADSATIDHVFARAKGGPDVEENTVAACAACNVAKAHMLKEEFHCHPVRLRRLKEANTPPDRLSADPRSPFYNSDALARGVGVYFRNRERDNVEEYCASEGWARIPAGKSVNRHGRPLTVKLYGRVVPYFRDL